MTATDEQISGVLTTAFEGGSNHWVDSLEGDKGEHRYYSDAIADGGEFKVLIDDYPSQTITKAKVIEGIRLYEEQNKKEFDFEFCTTDAGDADEVLQFALFGEQVFG
jgi:hypothetical protein